MRRDLFISVMFVGLGLMISCNNSENIINDNIDVVDEADEHEFQDSISAQYILNEIFELNENGKYTLKKGVCLDETEPNKYYYVCSSMQEAALFYNSTCTREPLDVVYERTDDGVELKFDVEDRNCSFGKYGRTSFSIGDGNPVYATIEFSFNAIGETYELMFVPKSYMPDNAYHTSPYFVGDILLDTQGHYWICVKESWHAGNGYLVRLTDGDGKYWIRKKIKDYYKEVWYAEATSGNTIACGEAWDGFLGITYDQAFEDAYDFALKNEKIKEEFAPTIRLMESLMAINSEKRIFQAGEVTVEGPNIHWWACTRDLYQVTIPYVVIHGTGRSFRGTCFAWHELDENQKDLKSTSLEQGQEMLQRSFTKYRHNDMSFAYNTSY